MSAKMHMLKVVVSERLTQVAEEICSLVEKILLEYEQDLYREITPQMDLHLHTTTDVSLQRFTGLVLEESCDDSPKENHNISDPEEALPRPEPSIKEEQEDEWSAGFEDSEPQAPPQRHEKDTEVIKFISSPVCKSEQLSTEPAALFDTKAQYTTLPPEAQYTTRGVPCTSTEPCGAAVKAVLCLPADFQTLTEPYTEAELAADGGATAPCLCHCMVCKVSFSDRSSLWNHAIVHGDDGVPKCGICGKLQPTREGLLEHLQIHVHVCECCGKTFSRHKDLSVHKRCHTGQKRFTCKPYAEAELVADGGATAPCLCHCMVCKASFSNRSSLWNHAKVHGDDGVPKCGICGKKQPTRECLLEHLQIHVHVCECCGKTFSRHMDLRVHKRCHAGQKPFTCKVCRKGFSHKRGMEIHMNKHTDEKPYRCSVCGKCFRIASGLIRHSRSHSQWRSSGEQVKWPPGTETICQSRP